jgi:hypothetical protein
MNGSKQVNALVQCDCMSAPAYKLLSSKTKSALKHSLRGNCHWADSNRTSNDAQTRASYQDEMTKLVTDRHHNETLMILTQATSRTQSLICCITCSKAIKKTYQHEDSTCTQFQRKAKL